MKKRLLVDLSSLKNLYSGLGQIALSYGYYFKDNYHAHTSLYELTLLVPKRYIGAFGNKMKYISSTNWFRKYCPYTFPKFDIWHSIHQLSRFGPFHSSTKLILTIHDLNYLYERTGNSKIRRHRRLQKKIDRADEIVCISEFTKREVERELQLHDKECKVIYNKVQLLDERMASRPAFDVIQPFFFTLGIIKRKKNFHVLLDLMKLIPEKHLYIIGSGADKKHNTYALNIKRRIREENISNVTLHEAISYEEKIWMYRNCEAFLFPSLLEGFGIPVIEAMQFGKPVFSSQQTSLKEIGSIYAYFWDNFEPEPMKQVIDRGLNDFYKTPGLAEVEKSYAEKFSGDQHFHDYEEIYRTI
ncbi:glycosyltransferase family 1 protein [Proteiniphilum sp. X52]|uniref:glycosyltransferase family 4 protein n=1 Tax=Proteiniphilum sp. X52 TaxID=2382159 RepID=UPI000F0A7115|nr:glycosyltransferase family 1 protein [Proteiniphilum sp. X52]RNC64272.1 glycosyltransferase family 1 protein [Proteiniphilum sp. X52]